MLMLLSNLCYIIIAIFKCRSFFIVLISPVNIDLSVSLSPWCLLLFDALRGGKGGVGGVGGGGGGGGGGRGGSVPVGKTGWSSHWKQENDHRGVCHRKERNQHVTCVQFVTISPNLKDDLKKTGYKEMVLIQYRANICLEPFFVVYGPKFGMKVGRRTHLINVDQCFPLCQWRDSNDKILIDYTPPLIGRVIYT